MERTGATPRVLVIKLGALGDFLLSLGPMRAIRDRHPEAHLTLLTRPAYRELGQACGLFDRVIAEPPPPPTDLAGVLRLRRTLRAHGADRVYDLQTSRRTAWYFRLCHPDPPIWSGKVAGCALRHVYPADHRMHTLERQRAQLAVAGIAEVPVADLSFLDGETGQFELPTGFALLIPGASADHPAKRWPPEGYAAIAGTLLDRGLTPVVVGGEDGSEAGRTITAIAGGAIDLTGRTSLGQLAGLARTARLAIGNDTGPTHLVSLCGCPTLALFGAESDPAKTGPAGPRAAVLDRPDLSALDAAEVIAALPLDWAGPRS